MGEPAGEAEVAEFLDGVDAVVHLAWALQPGRRPDDLHRVNVEGTLRVVRAAAAAGVRQFVHMSSIGAYAPGSDPDADAAIGLMPRINDFLRQDVDNPSELAGTWLDLQELVA